MVWGGFCGSIKSDLAFIPGKATLYSAVYVTTVMEPHLFLYGIAAARSMGGR